MDPQSNYSAIFVDIDILVDSIQVDQLKDVKRIMDIPADERTENDMLKYKNVVSSINGYGRLVYYKLFCNPKSSNSMEISPENCAIMKVQEGKFKEGLMHGYGREFDTQQSNCAVNLGYFKDGKPFVGRFEKFEMDEMELSSSHDTPSKQKESEP